MFLLIQMKDHSQDKGPAQREKLQMKMKCRHPQNKIPEQRD
jgi:hypothetical protein